MNKKKTFITFIFVNISIIAVAFSLFHFFIVQVKKAEAKAIIEQYQQSMLDSSYTTIQTLFEDLAYLNERFDIDYLTQYVSDNASIRRFVYFFEYDNEGFEYLDFKISFADDDLAIYNFGFFDQYFYVFNEEIIGISKINTVFGQILAQSSANNAFLMNKNGLIYFHLDERIATKALHEYVSKVNTTDYMTNEFKNGEPVYFETKIDNNLVGVSFYHIKDYPFLYLGQVFSIEILNSELFKHNVIYGTILVFVVFSNLFLLIFLYRKYYLQDSFFGGLVNTKFKTNSFLVVLNKHGDVIRVSRNMNDIIHHSTKYNINDFKNLSNTLTAFEAIIEGNPFDLMMKENIIRFHVLKKGKLFYLLGELITSDGE